jgi:hypothetical protein
VLFVEAIAEMNNQGIQNSKFKIQNEEIPEF